METLLQDLRYGARQLWRSRGFSIAAIATLALGIGANTALFSLGSAVLDRPAAGVRQSDDLIWVTAIHTNSGRPTNMSFPDLVAVRAGLRDVATVAGTIDSEFSVTAGDEAERVRGEVVSANYFTVLRSSFALGRGFLPAEDSVGRPEPVIVVSHAFWQRRLRGDSAAIGTSISVNGAPMTIVGVTAEYFNGADLDLPRSLWMPIAAYAATRPELTGTLGQPARRWIKGIARLEPGATPDRAAAAARLIFGQLAKGDTARYKGISAGVFSARSGVPAGGGNKILPVMILSIVVTGLVLLIACANVSNLLLARAVARRREIGVRLSLGAGRLRLMRQLLTESFLLALVAGGVGILLAFWTTDWLVRSGVFPLRLDMTPDAAVIGFTTAAAATAAILFGIVPAFESTRGNLADVARDGARGRDPRSSRLQSGFVVAQVALSLVLLTTAGLFLRSMYKALQMDIGFQASAQVLAMSFDLDLQQYSDDRAAAFLQQIDDRARGLPGVETVTFADVSPLSGFYIIAAARAEGGASGDSTARTVVRGIVRPGFFSAIRVPILHGRDFTNQDGPSAPRVAIVSDGFARESWPGQNPVGKRISLANETEPFLTVVGVAADIMIAGPDDDTRPAIYVAQRQHPEIKQLTMLVRTAGAGSAGALANALRREIRAIDPALPVFDVHTLAEQKRLRLADRQNGAAILGAFGALALLLASIGVYGVMSFSVAQRTREIGIRVALGAKRSDVARMFIARGMRLTGIAIVIGATLSLGLTRLIGGMLFGLTPTDAGTFAGVAGLLAGIALLACWFPARRAAAVDPATALRTD